MPLYLALTLTRIPFQFNSLAATFHHSDASAWLYQVIGTMVVEQSGTAQQLSRLFEEVSMLLPSALMGPKAEALIVQRAQVIGLRVYRTGERYEHNQVVPCRQLCLHSLSGLMLWGMSGLTVSQMNQNLTASSRVHSVSLTPGS